MTDTISKKAPSAVMPSAPPALANYFSRKIGNTTFVVSVSFNEKASESIDDKILRLVASDIQQGAGRSPDSELPAYATGEVEQCV